MKGRWRKREREKEMKQLEMHRKEIIGMTADPANEELSRGKRGLKNEVAPSGLEKPLLSLLVLNNSG